MGVLIIFVAALLYGIPSYEVVFYYCPGLVFAIPNTSYSPPGKSSSAKGQNEGSRDRVKQVQEVC